jgi:hypothetical protein
MSPSRGAAVLDATKSPAVFPFWPLFRVEHLLQRYDASNRFREVLDIQVICTWDENSRIGILSIELSVKASCFMMGSEARLRN